MSDKKYWLGFNLVQQVGSVSIQRLLAFFGNLQDAWHAKASDLAAAELNKPAIQSLVQARQQLDLDEEMQRVDAVGARLITFIDSEFPDNLRTISDPPMLLYVKGSLLPTDMRALAVVGTRKMTRYGHDATTQTAQWLAKQGVTIISGMADGVDAIAHEAALAAGGRTIAVFGCGIDIIYPSHHDELSEKIMQHGALVSEFPLGVPPTGTNFPRRNRIISGLSLGVLVAEAPERSGALITAETALEQGREVFAIPSNIFNQNGAGCNRLIQDGAKLVMHPRDILDELDISHTAIETRTKVNKILPEDETERLILQYLEADAIHADDLARITGLPIATVTAVLTILELKGLAQSAGHMQYCRTN